MFEPLSACGGRESRMEYVTAENCPIPEEVSGKTFFIQTFLNRAAMRRTSVIFLGFLLTSTAWLSWEYHLIDQVPARTADVCTMIIGYLLQAAGIGTFSLVLRRKPETGLRLMQTALILHMICMVLAVMSPYTAGTLLSGFLMNYLCGLIAGYYLRDLGLHTDKPGKGTVFGLGYGLATLASWLLSLSGGSIYYSRKVLYIAAGLTVLTWFAVKRNEAYLENAEDVSEAEQKIREQGRTEPDNRRFILLATVLVLLFSLVNSSGFAFPAADLGGAVNVELSRVFYGAGLILAGYVTDKNRKYGAVCALAALVIPFMILALRRETIPVVIFWVLSYFAFGFYAVYRVILFSDIAEEKGWLYLAGAGLLVGRIGDAVGEGICILLGNHVPALVLTAALLFVAAVAVFFIMYPLLYISAPARPVSEEEKFYQFSMQHELSAREQDMLRHLLEKKTNTEIAEVLCISENTVKFHVRNLLQKTGCKNRNALLSLYKGDFSA